MKITYPQLVKNIADALRTATGSTEPIAVGELPNKVTEAIGSGGGSTQKPMTVETGVEVVQPVYANTEIEINNGNLTVETNVALEESEE